MYEETNSGQKADIKKMMSEKTSLQQDIQALQVLRMIINLKCSFLGSCFRSIHFNKSISKDKFSCDEVLSLRFKNSRRFFQCEIVN